MQEFFSAVSNFGFPVVVAGYLLFRFENKLEKLDVSISGRGGLSEQISDLKSAIDHLLEELRK